MKTSKITFQAIILLLSLGYMPDTSLAQSVNLTGILQNGTSASGQTIGSPIWNTLGNETSFANIYLTQPNAGYNASFVNSGNGAGASVSFNLTPGNYQFYFFGMGFWDNDPGTYGLNLFFNGDNVNPGISAYTTANSLSGIPVLSGLPTLSLNGDINNPVSATGSLVYVANGLSVTLTGYGFGLPGVFGGSALDRVGNLDSNPDSYTDSVGVFALSVGVVPEPSTIKLFCIAFAFFIAMRWRATLFSFLR